MAPWLRHGMAMGNIGYHTYGEEYAVVQSHWSIDSAGFWEKEPLPISR